MSGFFVLVVLLLASTVQGLGTEARAAGLTADPSDFVRAVARASARIVYLSEGDIEAREEALAELARENLDRNRFNRFLVRTTQLGEGQGAELLDAATEDAVRRIGGLLNDPAVSRLYPSKVALLPNGRAMVETRIDSHSFEPRIWIWQLTRVELPNGHTGWGLLDIVAEDRQSVALSARRSLQQQLIEMEARKDGQDEAAAEENPQASDPTGVRPGSALDAAQAGRSLSGQPVTKISAAQASPLEGPHPTPAR